MVAANLITISIIFGIRYHLWKLGRTRPDLIHRWNPFNLRSSGHQPTDQYDLRGTDTFYSSHLNARDLLATDILRSHSQRSRGLVLLPLTSSQPSHDPPPSYHQVSFYVMLQLLIFYHRKYIDQIFRFGPSRPSYECKAHLLPVFKVYLAKQG